MVRRQDKQIKVYTKSRSNNALKIRKNNKMRNTWKDEETKDNQERELDRIRHEIEVAKLQLELEQLKLGIVPIKVK